MRHGFDSLSFAIHKNRRYHELLWRFYASWRDRMKIVTAIAGSGAFLLITGEYKPQAEAVAAFVALWAVLDIIIAPDKKAETHRLLCEECIGLAEQITRAPVTEESLQHLLAGRLRMEKNEPPTKRLIELLARNDECRARNYSADDQVPLSKWQRRFGYYFTFGMKRVDDWKAKRQRLAATSV